MKKIYSSFCLAITQNPDTIKENGDKFAYMKVKIVANIIKKVKRQISNWQLIFAKYSQLSVFTGSAFADSTNKSKICRKKLHCC